MLHLIFGFQLYIALEEKNKFNLWPPKKLDSCNSPHVSEIGNKKKKIEYQYRTYKATGF